MLAMETTVCVLVIQRRLKPARRMIAQVPFKNGACFAFTLFQYQASNIMNSHFKNVSVLNIHYQLRGGVVRVARVESPWMPVQAEQLYSCSQCLLVLVLEAFQAIAVLHDLQVGGGGALKGQGSFG